ncbi:MAG: hypothetical protein EP330_11295 [Deltaproteobacteria bacterium]|nr:MAG: hypothetical protein EP330_11295 [Deltaproteobacteria bacterium]
MPTVDPLNKRIFVGEASPIDDACPPPRRPTTPDNSRSNRATHACPACIAPGARRLAAPLHAERTARPDGIDNVGVGVVADVHVHHSRALGSPVVQVAGGLALPLALGQHVQRPLLDEEPVLTQEVLGGAPVVDVVLECILDDGLRRPRGRRAGKLHLPLEARPHLVVVAFEHAQRGVAEAASEVGLLEVPAVGVPQVGREVGAAERRLCRVRTPVQAGVGAIELDDRGLRGHRELPPLGHRAPRDVVDRDEHLGGGVVDGPALVAVGGRVRRSRHKPRKHQGEPHETSSSALTGAARPPREAKAHEVRAFRGFPRERPRRADRQVGGPCAPRWHTRCSFPSGGPMQNFSLLAVLALSLTACQTEGSNVDVSDLDAFSYTIDLPVHYTAGGPAAPGAPPAPSVLDADNTQIDNPVTDEGARLGRVLFYDVDLSQNRTIACGSCHVQELGFSDDAALSTGFDGGATGRHSMSLANARFYAGGEFFWDQRAETLEDQVLMPLQDAVEMGMTLDEVVERVEEDERYAPLFANAFGDDEVSTDRISLALAQFVRSMVSTTSRYDVGRAQVATTLDDFPNFTADENAGKTLFYAPVGGGGVGCVACHGTDAQIAATAISNGLDAQTTDEGYGGVSGDNRDLGTFKVPSLRNVAETGPYMHDGRFDTLAEVIEHYSSGVQFHPTLPPFWIGMDGEVVQLDMSATQKSQLEAFLHTLTDDAMLEDPRWSDPGW